MKKNEKGFTLVELLAVIVILGLLMAIAIPSVTKYITQSRVKTLVSTMDSYVTAVVTQVNDGEYKFSDSTKIYAIPIECIELEKGGQSPFGNWMQANESYWAYVLVHYDNVSYSYQYGFTFKDDAGYGLYPTINSMIENSMVRTGYDDLNQPKDGLAKDFVILDKWEGFNNITSTTELVVLEAESEGKEGNGQTTCTLCQKGDNYDAVEEEKIVKAAPKVSLKVITNGNKIKIIGTFENYNESEKYYDVTSHGLLYIQANLIGARSLTVDTSGRYKINSGAYNTDGSFSYSFVPSNNTTVYAYRAFLTYIDPKTNKITNIYSDMIRSSYADLNS